MIVRTCLTAFAGLLAVLFFKLYRVRSHVRSSQKQGLPMPPHSFLFGHLQLVADIVKNMPPYAHGVYVANAIRQKYPHLDTAFYLDVWPVGKPYLMVINPDMVHQFTQANQLPKDPGLTNFLAPLAGKQNLVTMEGAPWKTWRRIFNPGFSGAHILSLVPGMVDKIEVYRKKLERHAEKGGLFFLEEMVLNLTVDIIGGAVMDHDFRSQSHYNDMTSALRHQIEWSSTGVEINPFQMFNFLRPFVNMYNTYRMNRYLYPLLSKRYASISGPDGGNPGKSVIDLALSAYRSENPSAASRDIPPAFTEAAISQIKLFIFAGHDTTSSATIFTYDLLSKHPECLAKVRAEHDSVFGPDPSHTGALLREKPHLLNQLTYTLACIKEAMRIYPVVACLRIGQPNFTLVSPSGTHFPTANTIVLGDHYGLHHNPSVWPDAETYLPERWLVGEGDPLYPPKHAWRPFERGPRNCIGSELALTEMKIILAMTLRSFDIQDAYAAFDERRGNPKGWQVNGSRTYMTRGAGAGHPADGYPCTVRLRG
ncbi:cytochrome P450 [Sporormia fimetaria CBS 119925]|uniref:Cytochrome P450 n=1 Tax=Sporormia fimetaria CBS 119925 TaxID=1340428 RepID=A0A6A6V016_9PLEO|nr:cytochrome P450 [Sporormia fimetaria CBS 119925]